VSPIGPAGFSIGCSDAAWAADGSPCFIPRANSSGDWAARCLSRAQRARNESCCCRWSLHAVCSPAGVLSSSCSELCESRGTDSPGPGSLFGTAAPIEAPFYAEHARIAVVPCKAQPSFLQLNPPTLQMGARRARRRWHAGDGAGIEQPGLRGRIWRRDRPGHRSSWREGAPITPGLSTPRSDHGTARASDVGRCLSAPPRRLKQPWPARRT